MENLILRAEFSPTTINEEKRTVDVVFATETPVKRYDWRQDRYFNEILEVTESAINATRLDKGAPLLNSHSTYGLDKVIGVVERYWIEGGKAMATVKFSARKEVENIFKDVKDGILRNISVGYSVQEYNIIEKEDNELPEYRAVKWTPAEISLVPVPADPESTVRSQSGSNENNQENNNQENINQLNSNTMRNQLVELLTKRGIEFNADATEAELLAIVERSLAAPAVENTIDVSGEIRTALNNERERVRSINEQAEILGLERSIADELIKEGVSAETAAVRMIAKASEKQPNVNNTATVGAARADELGRVIEAALELRFDPTAKAPEGVRAEDVQAMASKPLMAISEVHLRAKGIDTSTMGTEEIGRAALNLSARGMMTTSDLPLLLNNSASRTLLRSYEAAPRTFQAWTRREDHGDFKETTGVDLISGGVFEEVKEGGEYKNSNVGESDIKFKLKKYGTIIGFSWESIVNDDLGALMRIPQMFGANAAAKQTDIVYSLLTSNPVMPDGNALFSAAHGNLGTAAQLSIASLDLAYQSFMTQKNKSGLPINIKPKFLIVGPANMNIANSIVKGTYYANTPQGAGDQYRNLIVIEDASIVGNGWYLSADPNVINTFRYGFLRGYGELTTTTQESFRIDAQETKFRMVFGASIEDYRGLYYNPGL